MVWEAVFLLLVLKIPVIYVAFVVWWALRADPDRGEAAEVAAVSDTPPGGPGLGAHDRAPRRPTSTRPHGRRAAARMSPTRAGVAQ